MEAKSPSRMTTARPRDVAPPRESEFETVLGNIRTQQSCLPRVVIARLRDHATDFPAMVPDLEQAYLERQWSCRSSFSEYAVVTEMLGPGAGSLATICVQKLKVCSNWTSDQLAAAIITSGHEREVLEALTVSFDKTFIPTKEANTARDGFRLGNFLSRRVEGGKDGISIRQHIMTERDARSDDQHWFLSAVLVGSGATDPISVTWVRQMAERERIPAPPSRGGDLGYAPSTTVVTMWAHGVLVQQPDWFQLHPEMIGPLVGVALRCPQVKDAKGRTIEQAVAQATSHLRSPD